MGSSGDWATAQTLSLLLSGSFEALKETELNALEAPAIRMLPQIAEVKRQLLAFGALHCLMSGSGSAVYGVFPGENEAREAARGLEGAIVARTTEG